MQPIEDDEKYSPCQSLCRFDNSGDSGYESDGSVESTQSSSGKQRNPTTSFDWVRQMIETFMSRRTASPMQWMLDLRTYGLKIHYNTTSIGHVNWKDTYTLEYKQVLFTID